MKTLKNTKIYFMVISAIIMASVLFGCSEQSGIFNPTGSGSNGLGEAPPAGDITVQIQPESGGFTFVVSNTTTDTINDFYVQFDSTVSITEWGLAWQMDPATTNLEKGKIGEKARPNDQQLLPGQQNRPLLWVKVRFNGRSVNKNFDWQATKNGVTVKSGRGTLP
jgi:hypothetical protein